MKSKTSIITVILILIIGLFSLFINNKSFSEKILGNVQGVIMNGEENNFFEEEINTRLIEYMGKMDEEGFFDPELSFFETPQGDKLYILVKAKSIEYEDGEAVSYIIFNIVGEKIIDMTISTWATVSPEKRNF